MTWATRIRLLVGVVLVLTAVAPTDGVVTGLAVPGTPVEAGVELDDDGPLAAVDEAFRRFLRGLGL